MNLSHPLSWWLANDIVLQEGQIGLINDIGCFKQGDGANPFSGLSLQGLQSVNVWFSEYGLSENKGSALTTIYHEHLIGGTLTQEGGWIEFSFVIKSANNLNTKNVLIKFSNQTIFSLSLPVAAVNKVLLSGKIKILDYFNKKAFYEARCDIDGNTTIIGMGELSAVNWAANQDLLLQLQGNSNGDIVSYGGDGTINLVPRFS